jgi:hypothetical protein
MQRPRTLRIIQLDAKRKRIGESVVIIHHDTYAFDWSFDLDPDPHAAAQLTDGLAKQQHDIPAELPDASG